MPEHAHRPILLDGARLSVRAVERVARDGARVELADAAREALAARRAIVDNATADGDAHYGINTGFGSLARTRIPADELGELQHNLLRSHAAGVGEALPDEVVRAMMLLLAASLARGLSGVRPILVEHLCALLNAGVSPVVPAVGSVGASGDLAPLAHIGIVLIGEGRARVGSVELTGREALARAGIEPIALGAKEGLALINGTHLMAARGALLVADFDRLFDAALIASAMSLDGLRGTSAHLDPRVHAARTQPGQILVAQRLRDILAGSTILPSHVQDDPRVQDPYSLRCVPAVLGAAWDNAEPLRLAVACELGAVTDNPLIFDAEPTVVSAGNFHGMPLAIPLDTAAIALAHIAGIAERRVYLMLAARDPEAGLTPYLAAQPGLQSGLMIAQYTAAACCNEIATLCTPASPINIPTSAGIEDYNSFGPRSAAKAARALELARWVVAIELVCAAEALEHQRPLRSGAAVERAHAIVRTIVPPLTHDRSPAPAIAQVADLIQSGAFAADDH